MTPSNMNAENVAFRLFGLFLQGCSQVECERKISDALQQAYQEGFAGARERAARISEFHSGPSIQCAEKIRSLQPSKENTKGV